ncbi:hypothetical protein RND81_12G026400 [Saponaria officinalis]|uniref:Rho GDP-dissociation inhibitor n=1 Tax=Saponaria officinalis TaxID=3572 RepID=A0AAW1H4E6_SAPOF
MSTVVESLPTLNNNNNNIVSSNMKDNEEKNMSLKQSLRCELRENIDIVVKDLTKDISTNEEIDDNDDDKKLEKHVKTDESNLSNEKLQQLPSSIAISVAEGKKEAEVKIMSLTVKSPGRADEVLTIPFKSTTSKATLFTLKEGSKYQIKFLFTVSSTTVHNLKYTYMVWKSGVRVHQTKKMVGTFRPREEPYVYELEEGTTPSGFFARGPFFVRSKFVDDDGNCYLDATYYFDIRKDWGVKEKC